MRGDPVRWASLDGDRLHVYAFVVAEDGTYELQIYDRVLTEKGIDIEFQRIVDDEVLRRITGTHRARRVAGRDGAPHQLRAGDLADQLPHDRVGEVVIVRRPRSRTRPGRRSPGARSSGRGTARRSGSRGR